MSQRRGNPKTERRSTKRELKRNPLAYVMPEQTHYIRQAPKEVAKLRPKTLKQAEYLRSFDENTITFGIGPAGTGKSFVAGAYAADLLKDGEVDKIILTRPGVEAGESFGFLPGEIEDKYAPFLEPFMDVLNERLGKSYVQSLIKNGQIVASPLSFMRGKAEPISSLIPTPNGYVRMGDIRIGDYVFGSDGKPTLVTGVFPQGVVPVVDVMFTDGSIVRCCKNHLWNTRTQSQRSKNLPYTTKITSDIQESIKNKHGHRNHEIPVLSAPVEFMDSNIIIDPYIIGCLLGDGSISCGTIQFCSKDTEIIDNIQQALPTGVSISKNKSSIHGYDYYITKNNNTPKNTLKDGLRLLDLWGTKSNTKFVPENYLFASSNTRLGVLQGLLDTDGSIFDHRSGRSRIEFSSTSQQLALDVKWLVESLGGIGRLRIRDYSKEQHISNFKHNYNSYVVDIVMPDNINPFRLSRKATKHNPSRLVRLIDDVVDVGEEECQCISVSNMDRLYLTGNFVVTHNTFNDAVIILDEAQNTSPSQMKMFLTRIGENSKMIIDGDMDQTDMRGVCGLQDAIDRLDGLNNVGIVEFGVGDIVRNGIIKDILRAYAK